MKRFTLILLTVLSATACRQATPEQQITKISKYFGEQATENYAENLRNHDAARRVDYLTLTLAKELGAKDIWTLENAGENSLVAEFPGQERYVSRYSVLSASLDDPDACAAVLQSLKACKDLKIKPKGSIHALFYSPEKDTVQGTTGLGAFYQEITESGEMITFEMEISSRDSLSHTIIIEDNAIFADQFIQVIPPYLAPMGSYQFRKGRYPNRNWPVKATVYRYNIDPADIRQESAVITALTMLLN